MVSKFVWSLKVNEEDIVIIWFWYFLTRVAPNSNYMVHILLSVLVFLDSQVDILLIEICIVD